MSAGERLSELAGLPDHSAELAELVGRSSGKPNLSPDAVNLAMIRHWVEAMGDENPVYTSDAAAQAAGFDQLIAPPTMLQAWIMRGLKASNEVEAARAAGTSQGAGPNDRMMQLLDDEGLTSVVATNCEQDYGRSLVVGDRVLTRSVIESISDPKRTALGTGRFVTTRMDYVALPDADVPRGELSDSDVSALFDKAEPVATMRFRILKYLPVQRPKPADAGTPGAGGVEGGQGAPAPSSPRMPRPRPALTHDNAFWFEGARAHQLLIQRCTSCGRLRHPPLPACSNCGSFEWDTVQSTGRGTLFSYVVVHYPQVPAFEYPLPIGLVELEEGTRVVANLDMDPDSITVGMPLRVTFVDYDDELSLPVFVADGTATAMGAGTGTETGAKGDGS
jgi:3-oxo-4,17-pregnadiene-20-carboxyl-CoA hydratase alpha subunit